MAAMPNTTKKNFREDMLLRIYLWQRRVIDELGITLPPESELFAEGCPLETKVSFYRWVLSETLG
jgi:hypothetical protein